MSSKSNDWEELVSQEWADEPVLVEDDGSYISASRVKKYKSCPRKYWFRYLTNREPTKADKGYRGLGIGVHESIENVLAEDPRLSQNSLSRKFKREYHDINPRIPDDMYDDGLTYLEVAAKYLAKTSPDIWDLEKEVLYGLKRPDIDSQILAIMDVTTDTGILDWKTGRIRDETPVEEQIQGAMYMQAYNREYGETPEEINFVYLKEEKVRSLEPSDENWETMLRHARSMVRGVQNNDFKAKPGGQCYFCGWEGYCEAAPAGVGGVEWQKF